MSKRKYIEDAAKVIDRRVEALEAELEKDLGFERTQMGIHGDRQAILEAKHLARLIRSLKRGPYRDPYEAATQHWARGHAADNMNLD